MPLLKSLLSVVNGILNEIIERKNGEISHVGCSKAMQSIIICHKYKALVSFSFIFTSCLLMAITNQPWSECQAQGQGAKAVLPSYIDFSMSDPDLVPLIIRVWNTDGVALQHTGINMKNLMIRSKTNKSDEAMT